jgi:putative oxidoreductase
MLESMRNGHALTPAHSLALLPTRAALGSTMLYHGYQKLRDRENAGRAFEGMGLAPGRPWALATALAEMGAGALAVIGVFTRPAALAVLVTQAVAVAKVHRQKGFDNTKGGFEFNLALMAIAAGLLLTGPGHVSVHRQIERAIGGRRRKLFARGPRRRGSKLAQIVASLLR